jgi:hypothetical protein
MTMMREQISMTARLGGWLLAAIATSGLAASCVPGEDLFAPEQREPLDEAMDETIVQRKEAHAAAPSTETAPNCPQQFVTGYYAGY